MPYEHLVVLNDHLLQLVDGRIDRLMVTMPPQHGKSELISKWFPAWYLGTFPTEKVLLASYQATYAHMWGRRARETLTEFGPEVFGVHVADEPRRQDWWFTDQDGYMASDGREGSFTGKSAHLIIIDDPIKGHEDARSEVEREKLWNFWVETLSTRTQNKNAVVVVQTRWHEDDLAGRLLANEGDEWTVLNLPALAEENDALGRAEGEPLCPELHPLHKLERQRRKGAYAWAALYQQRPAPLEGFLFKRSDFRYWRTDTKWIGSAEQQLYVLADDDGPRVFDIPATPRFQVVDAAISEKEMSDYTVCATWALTEQGDLILLDLERHHFEEAQVIQFLAAQNDKHGRLPMWIEQFGAGRNPLARLRAGGRPVMEIPAEAGARADKMTRAIGAMALCQAHKLFFPANRPDWLSEYEHELVSFPNATHDDMVDVTAYAARLVPIFYGEEIRPQRTDGPRPHTSGVRREQF